MKRRSPIFGMATVPLMLLAGIVFISACDGSGQREAYEEQNNEEMATEPEMKQQNYTDEKQNYKATLEGRNEVPEVETNAEGTVFVTLKNDSIHINGKFSGLSSDYTASHIHKGAEGENGDPIITLHPDINDDNTSGSWKASCAISQEQISALEDDSLYINVHSENHKSGEIRDQLTSSEL